MYHKKKRKPPCRKIVRLPDLDQAKSAVLNSLSSPCSRRNYKFAMEQFIIVAALEGGRGGYAKETLTELRSFLKGQTQHSAFRKAHAYLPHATTNLSQWKSELAYSRFSIEDYLRALERKTQ